MFIIAYILFFGFLYLYYKRFKSPALNFVLLFYVLASVCGVLMHFFKTNNISTLFSFLYQVVILYLFIHPIVVYGKNERLHRFKEFDDKRFKYLTYSLIALQLFSIVFFIGYDVQLLLRGDLSQLRAELLSGDENMGASFYRTVAGTASYYYCINILLFFYSLAFRNEKKIVLILLIISSTSRIFHSLTYMGRDGILFWIISFVFSYFLFLPYLNRDSKKIVRKLFYLCGSFAIVLIGMISISRFGESDSGTFWSLISYFGQPIDNFGKMFVSSYSDFKGTSEMFPLLYGKTGTLGSEVINSADTFELQWGFRNDMFYTFVGNMYVSWGPIITFVIAVVYCFYMTNKLSVKNVGLSTLIILMVASQIVLHNYFYWAYYARVANLFLFTIPIFVLYCRKSKVAK